MFDGTSVTVAGWRGIGRSCMPNARVARRPTIEPTAMPSIAGAIILDSPAIIAIIGSRHRRIVAGPRGPAESERGGHLGEQVAIGVERAARPLAPGHHLGVGAALAGADHVGDVEPGDPGEVGEGEAHGRIDVGFRRAAGRAELGELAGRVPVQRALPGQRLGQVAEHRQRRERVVGGSLGGSSGSSRRSSGSSAMASMRGCRRLAPAACPRRRRSARRWRSHRCRSRCGCT